MNKEQKYRIEQATRAYYEALDRIMPDDRTNVKRNIKAAVTRAVNKAIRPKKATGQAIHPADVPMWWNDDCISAWSDWCEHRKELRKPMTQIASNRAVSRLAELSAGDPQKTVNLINHAIYKGWQGFYPVPAEQGDRQAEYRQLFGA